MSVFWPFLHDFGLGDGSMLVYAHPPMHSQTTLTCSFTHLLAEHHDLNDQCASIPESADSYTERSDLIKYYVYLYIH